MALQNIEANITLDLYNHDTTPATVKAIQLDSQTRYVAAMLQSMGAEYGLDSNATVQLIVVRPDKVGVQITGTTFTYGDESSEYLGPYAELTQVALAVSGKMRGQFKITSGTQILRTEIFAISNGEALDASTDEWADEYDGYNLEEMAASIETNTADIATLEADVSQIKEDFETNAYNVRTNVAQDTDLNDLVDVGSYLLFANHVYTNMPPIYTSGAAWVFVVANTSKNYRLQIFVHHYWKKWAVRSYSKASSTAEGTWSDWVVYDDMQRALVGKKLSIIGDSISTFRGYIPDGYAYQYPTGDVTTVGKTWWKKLIDRTGMVLVANASWSGSTVTDDDSDPTNTAKVGYSDARIADLSSGGVDPDIVIVLFGTNDFSKGRGLGTLTERSEIPNGTTSINTFREAYACMLNKIRTSYPDAHVYCCTLIQRYYSEDTSYPILNGNGIALSEYNKAITDIATWIGCNIIRLDTLFTPASLPNYTTDGKLHPNTEGMTQIATRVAQVLTQNEIDYLG